MQQKMNNEWISRAQTSIDDCLVTSKSDILSRKMKLISGEHATLFFRTPSQSSSDNTLPSSTNNSNTLTIEDILTILSNYLAIYKHYTTNPIRIRGCN